MRDKSKCPALLIKPRFINLSRLSKQTCLIALFINVSKKALAFNWHLNESSSKMWYQLMVFLKVRQYFHNANPTPLFPPSPPTHLKEYWKCILCTRKEQKASIWKISLACDILPTFLRTKSFPKLSFQEACMKFRQMEFPSPAKCSLKGQIEEIKNGILWCSGLMTWELLARNVCAPAVRAQLHQMEWVPAARSPAPAHPSVQKQAILRVGQWVPLWWGKLSCVCVCREQKPTKPRHHDTRGSEVKWDWWRQPRKANNPSAAG